MQILTIVCERAGLGLINLCQVDCAVNIKLTSYHPNVSSGHWLAITFPTTEQLSLHGIIGYCGFSGCRNTWPLSLISFLKVNSSPPSLAIQKSPAQQPAQGQPELTSRQESWAWILLVRSWNYLQPQARMQSHWLFGCAYPFLRIAFGKGSKLRREHPGLNMRKTGYSYSLLSDGCILTASYIS